MVPWVVINRQHLPRPARGPRQARKPCPIRVSRLSYSQSSASNLIFLNVSKFGRLDFQICQNSPFGTHSPFIVQKIVPFFSCTYLMPILNPFYFQIHPWPALYPPPTINTVERNSHNHRYLHLHRRSR